MRQLTKFERTVLTTYCRWRTAPPTLASIWLAPRALLRLAGIVALLVILTWLASTVGVPLAVAVASFMCGVVFCELIMTARMVRVWPVLAQVFDWDRIDQTLADGAIANPLGEAARGSPFATGRPVSDNPYQSPLG